MDFYAILGVPRDADEQAIRTAFRILARRYHPDRGAGSSSERFRQVVEAYETLGDPALRRRYDLSLLPAVAPEPMSQWHVEPLRPPRRDPWMDEVWRAFEDDFLEWFWRW
jgi:curved DNA-binding protein CbpA